MKNLIYFKNRTDVKWTKLPDHLDAYQYKVENTPKDGYCLISSMRMCLLCDHGEMHTNDVIAELITSEIYNNNQYYIRYYSGDIKEMLRSLDMYITQGVYSHQIVDIVVLAAAKCLSVNLCIYKKYGDNAIFYMQPSNPPSAQDIYLWYNNEHYDAIISKNSSFQRSENATIDKMNIDPKEHNQITKNNVQLDRHHQLNTSVSHLLSPQDQLYFNNLGNSFTLESSGVHLEQQVLNTQKYPILNLTHDIMTNSPKNSPLQNERHKTLQNTEINDLPGYIPIKDKFQMEDYYSGDEDAVLYYAANNKQTQITTSTDETRFN